SATLPADVERALGDGSVDAVAFTSASTVRGFASLTADRAAPAVAIGPVTARAAREEGFRVAAVADPHTVAGLAAAVVSALGTAGSPSAAVDTSTTDAPGPADDEPSTT